MEIPEFAFSVEYLLFLLSVILTTLGLLFLGSVARSFRRKRPMNFKKKLLFFPVFVLGIFLVGWASEALQQGIFEYLQTNVATSVSGLLIALVVAWVLYDFVLWRR